MLSELLVALIPALEAYEGKQAQALGRRKQLGPRGDSPHRLRDPLDCEGSGA